MQTRALIFDIGGTVFDWHTAIVEALSQAGSADLIDAAAFAYFCRDRFLSINGAVMRRDRGWMTSDEILAAAIKESCVAFGLHDLPAAGIARLNGAWRNMPAWVGAREGIAALRTRFIATPLTILSWPMAVGSSRRNGIEWDSILSCDVLGIYKPDPRVYARAAEIIDCRSEELMMVAAHPSDLRAAKACGYRTAYVLPRLEDPGEDYTDTGFAGEFDIVAEDFPDLARRLA